MSENQWKCPKCGTLNQSKFCIRCGTPKPVAESKMLSDDSWFCMNCGQKNQGKFCTKCGKPKGFVPEKKPSMQITTMKMPPVQQEIAAGPLQPTQNTFSGNAYSGQQNQSAPSDKNKLTKIIAGVVVALALAGGGYYYYTTQQQAAETASMQEEAKPAEDESATVKEMKTDLSLGGLDLGDSKDDIKQVEKNPENDMKQEGALTRYYYDDMQIVIEDNKVVSLVSNNDTVETKKGLHQGSTFADVKKAYGTDYQKFDAGGGITCYEYSFKSQDGRDGLLRFAIKDSDHKVDYISVRIPDNAMEQEASSAGQTGTAKNNAMAAKAGNSAQQVLSNFHQAISSHNLSSAWNELTPEQQQRMGGYSSFQDGYADTLTSTLSNVTVQSATDSQVVLNYNLTARDRTSNGGVKVQTFTGSATLVPVDNTWKISYTESKKTGEHME